VSRYRKGTQFTANPTPIGLPIRTAVQAFLDHHERLRHSPRYIEELQSYLVGNGKRTQWLPLLPWSSNQGIELLQHLDRPQLEAYTAQASHAPPSVYPKTCAILAMFLRWCVAEGELSALPFETPRPKRLRSEIRVFTITEMLRLRDFVRNENVRDWAIFMLLLDTGMRTGELCQLQLADVHWDREEVVIRPETSKNHRGRTIPLSGSLSALRKYRALRSDSSDQCPNLFLAFYWTPVYSGSSRHDKRRATRSIQFSRAPLTRVGLYQLVAKWGRLAGITEARCSPHTFRHFFATEYLRNGGNIVVLQRILGHSRLDVTERYLRVVAADLTHSQKHFSPANAFASRSPRYERLIAPNRL